MQVNNTTSATSSQPQTAAYHHTLANLNPIHLDQLHKSAIADDVIIERGYFSEDDPGKEIALGFSYAQTRAGLILPLWTVDGQNGSYILRPDNPRCFDDKSKPRNPDGTYQQKHLKYENPKGSTLRLDCPPRCLPNMGNPKEPLWITEGVKKGDALASIGFCAIDLLGVWGSKGKNTYGASTWLVDWGFIALKDREVNIVFDSDVTTNLHVKDAFDKLNSFLTNKGAQVKTVYLPADSTGKMGVDDYLAAGHTAADLISMLALPRAVIPKTVDDSDLAEKWIKQVPLTAYGLNEWLRYSKGVWIAGDEDFVSREILKVIEAAKFDGVRSSSTRLASVKELARIKVSIRNEKWDADPDIIVCQNGAFHIPTMQLQPHKPEHLATFRVGYNYDPQARADMWKYALSTTIPESSDFLQEFVGYSLTIDTRYELALWLYGPPGSGKSTIIEGIHSMLGDRATLLGLADVELSRFALGDLRGKTLAVASEQPAIYMRAAHILNSIISGEKIRTERKFKDPIEFIPRVKLIWAMNELPRVSDAGNGLFRRVKVIKFPVLAESNRNPNVKEAIKTEGAGILNWALEGLARLRARGRFEVPACVKDATADFQLNNDVPALFVAERCKIDPAEKTQAQTLYNAYCAWCSQSGHKPMSSTSLANEWVRLGFTKKAANGLNYWHGVKLEPYYPPPPSP